MNFGDISLLERLNSAFHLALLYIKFNFASSITGVCKLFIRRATFEKTSKPGVYISVSARGPHKMVSRAVVCPALPYKNFMLVSGGGLQPVRTGSIESFYGILLH